jgi:hypothetical protein
MNSVMPFEVFCAALIMQRANLLHSWFDTESEMKNSLVLLPSINFYLTFPFPFYHLSFLIICLSYTFLLFVTTQKWDSGIYILFLRQFLSKKNGIFWDVTANVVPSSPIFVTLMKEALSSSETWTLTRATRRNIPEDAILHSHRRENLKSYNPCLF